VSLRQDYSVRAPRLTTDEIGLLTDTFNQMLAHIEEQNARLERRVRERTAELEAANRELEAFTSSAAHDLRTPLRAITGFSELILQQRASELPADVLRQIGMIRSGSDQMTRLIEDLLAFSRLGRQAVSVQSFDLRKQCEEVWASLESERHGRRCDLTIGNLGTVTADPALLRVVWVNLLSNALKYTRPRPVAVISISREDRAAGPPVFYVRDNGVGFDMRDATKLFGVFQRLHHAHEFEGTGVGLATVRRIIERHGGQIWADAAPGAGATFRFTLTDT
jgi:light-regulated signal transduction histidine kinase (bacteriophytochrome)